MFLPKKSHGQRSWAGYRSKGCEESAVMERLSARAFGWVVVLGSNVVRYVLVLNIRRRQWHPSPALLPRKSHGRRSLVGCSSRGCEESDTTEHLHFHFSLSCIGEGNGNPLQCSCLENPRDGGAWWAATYGVAQSRTLLSDSHFHFQLNFNFR